MSSGLTAIIIICIVCGMIVKLAKIALNKRDRDYNHDDTRTMQEIHRGLQRMERRIESLETLMMDETKVPSRTHARD